MRTEPATHTAYTPSAFPDFIAQALVNDGWSVAVTGASGWMGLALLEMLEPLDIQVAAFGSQAKTIALRSGKKILLRPTRELSALPKAKWLLVHGAYGTRDRVATQGPDAFIAANEQLTREVSDAMRAVRPQAMLFPSSGAVYNGDDIEKNPYGVLKHRDELHFTMLAQETGTKLAIPRVFNMAGPYINKWQAYALSDLIVQSLEGKTLTINSPGAVLRSYVHVADILSLCFAWLLDHNTPEKTITFDTQGEVDVEIADLAERVESLLPGKTRSPLRRADTNVPGNRYIGNGETMRQLCRRYHIAPMELDAQIRDTIDDIILRKEAP